MIQWQTLSGEPVRVADVTIIPQSQALSIRLPFGGLVWNRPISVVVRRHGRTESLPIPDPTRAATLAFYSIILALTVGGFFVKLMMRREKES